MNDLIYDESILDAAQSVALAGVLIPLSLSCQLNRAALKEAGVKADDIDGVRLTAQLYESTAPGGVPTSTAVGQPVRMVHVGGGSYVCGVPAPTVAGGSTFVGYVRIGLSYPIELPAGFERASISESDVAPKVRPVRFTRASA